MICTYVFELFYSLSDVNLALFSQLVVDMRSSEVRRLKEERAKHLQQLEELEDTRNKLSKMEAKVEDLQVQLDMKSKLER